MCYSIPIPRTAIRAASLQWLAVCAALATITTIDASAATAPPAPSIGIAAAGNGLATINFTPASANGGAPIAGYTATCFTGAVAGSPAIGGHSIGLDFVGPSHPSVSTNAFASTGGGIMLASVGRGVLSDFGSATVTDNKGNTYSQRGTSHGYHLWPQSGTALFSKVGAAGGSSHIVTTSKPSATDEVTIIAAEFLNVDTIIDSQWIEDLTSPNTSASVTTTGPAILAAFWWGDNGSGELNPAASAGWTVLDHTSSLASQHVQSASAYMVAPIAGTYSINWTPSTSQGAQLWIVAMQQVAGGPFTSVSASGTASPIIVKGLTNGVSYTCTVTARNAVGTGAPSAGVGVTPSAATPFALVSVQSRKTHGSAGVFDLWIDPQPPIGQITVEPRKIIGGHTIVFQFNGPVSTPGSADVTPPGSATATGNGNEVSVTLNNVPDNQRATITLANVNGAFSPSPLSLGFMLGDMNSTRAVNASDICAAKSRSGQATDGSNFKFDVDLSGSVNASDVSAVKAKSGSTLP